RRVLELASGAAGVGDGMDNPGPAGERCPGAVDEVDAVCAAAGVDRIGIVGVAIEVDVDKNDVGYDAPFGIERSEHGARVRVDKVYVVAFGDRKSTRLNSSHT